MEMETLPAEVSTARSQMVLLNFFGARQTVSRITVFLSRFDEPVFEVQDTHSRCPNLFRPKRSSFRHSLGRFASSKVREHALQAAGLQNNARCVHRTASRKA